MHAEEESLIHQSARAEENRDAIIAAKINVAANRAEHMKRYAKEYNQRPEIKERLRNRRKDPAWIAKNREYLSRPEVRERRRELGRKYRQKQSYKDKHRERQRREDVKEQARTRLINRKYGITKKEYDGMLERQGGVCAVCQTSSWGKKGPHIDHCHESGDVRGLLCTRCNSAAGLLDDLPEKAFLLWRYLLEAKKTR